MDFFTISTVVQSAYMLCTALLFFVKPFRNWFLGIEDRKRKDEEDKRSELESIKCLLRAEIVRIYYSKMNAKEYVLHQFEYENLSMLYTAYKKLGGNSFIDKIWSDMQEWEIIP